MSVPAASADLEISKTILRFADVIGRRNIALGQCDRLPQRISGDAAQRKIMVCHRRGEFQFHSVFKFQLSHTVMLYCLIEKGLPDSTMPPDDILPDPIHG